MELKLLEINYLNHRDSEAVVTARAFDTTSNLTKGLLDKLGTAVQITAAGALAPVPFGSNAQSAATDIINSLKNWASSPTEVGVRQYFVDIQNPISWWRNNNKRSWTGRKFFLFMNWDRNKRKMGKIYLVLVRYHLKSIESMFGRSLESRTSIPKNQSSKLTPEQDKILNNDVGKLKSTKTKRSSKTKRSTRRTRKSSA